jgi:type VI secretion system protein ImpA
LVAFVVVMGGRGLQGDVSNPDAYPDTARIDAARVATPFEFYQRLADEVPQAREALRALEAVVDARLGQHGPSFSATRDAVDDVGAIALRMAATAGVVLDEAGAPPPLPGDEPGDAAPAAPTRGNGEITTRKEALLQLRRVADFFRRTEPHSPVAYLADKAARWGNMPLHVWLKTVLKDNPALGQLEELLDVGIDEPNGNG